MRKGYLKRIVEVNKKCYKFVGRDYTIMGNFGTCLVKWMKSRNTNPDLIDKYITLDNCINKHRKLVEIINTLCCDLEPIFE